MEFSFSLKIKATKEAVWEYYANIENGMPGKRI